MRRFTTVVRLSAYYSDAASGWAGWPLAHSEFGSSVNPITTRGVDYAHHITASPRGFENPSASHITDDLMKGENNYFKYSSYLSLDVSRCPFQR